jgi:hypothetical protein
MKIHAKSTYMLSNNLLNRLVAILITVDLYSSSSFAQNLDQVFQNQENTYIKQEAECNAKKSEITHNGNFKIIDQNIYAFTEGYTINDPCEWFFVAKLGVQYDDFKLKPFEKLKQGYNYEDRKHQKTILPKLEYIPVYMHAPEPVQEAICFYTKYWQHSEVGRACFTKK